MFVLCVETRKRNSCREGTRSFTWGWSQHIVQDSYWA
jgi:hypothetical protein